MKKGKGLVIVFLMAVFTNLFALTAFSAELTPLKTPSWVRWKVDATTGGLYAVYEDVKGADNNSYQLRLYKDNELYAQNVRQRSKQGNSGKMILSFIINDSGSYTFEVKALGNGIQTSDSGWSGRSMPFVYQKPETDFGTVRNLMWSEKKAGTVTWDPPEEAAGDKNAYSKGLRYTVALYKDGELKEKITNITDTSWDYRQWMDEDGVYTFSVQAQSRKIENVAHGPEVFCDEPFRDLDELASEVENDLNNIVLDEASPSDALRAMEELDLEATAIAAQVNDDVLSRLSEIEQFYLENSGKTVEILATPSDIGFAPEELEVIGAGLNIASASNAVTVNITKPGQEADIDRKLYGPGSQFNIRLGGAEETLRSPVTIIMPIPSDISPERLRILHYHQDDSYDIIEPFITNDGEAKFTVTSFSIFAFVERKEFKLNGGGASGGGGSSSGGGGSLGGGSSAPYGTVTTDPKKGKVHSINGIITGSGDGYSKWISEIPQGQTGAGNILWKLQYADGTFASGSYVTDENGNPVQDAAGNRKEQLLWELINGAWYAFGADGYAKSGFIFDPALNGWFYVNIDTGMKTGWQKINEKWYYFNPLSDGTKGMMYVNRSTPDGYTVNADGVWEG